MSNFKKTISSQSLIFSFFCSEKVRILSMILPYWCSSMVVAGVISKLDWNTVSLDRQRAS